MNKYVTISVPREVKELLARKKGKKDWGDFLLELYMRAEYARMKEGFERLKELLTEEELSEIVKASEEFRERFKLR
ncbi:MAG: antitoxin VapB family protein [Thermosphaera sp.]|nr:antitoxin VapB family protein [Candidatus Nezhaarchaeota archaeon]